MKGEIIKNIYNPQGNEEWVLIETNKNIYSMRLGGFKIENDLNLNNYTSIDMPFKSDIINDIYTDEECVYLRLDSGNVIASGWVTELFGDMELGIKFTNVAEYEADFFESSFLFKLTIGSDGWSSKTSNIN